MPRRRDRADPVQPLGHHRPVAGPAQVVGDGRRARDLDDGLPGAERHELIAQPVAARILRIDLLDEDVLIVEIA